MNSKDLQVNLYYFGSRSYVDITTLSNSFYYACQIDPCDPRIESDSIRIYKAVKCHGSLVEGLQKNLSCSFSFSYKGSKYSYSFIESQTLISTRKEEPYYRPDDHFQIEGRIGKFKIPLTESMTYNLMALGKSLIVSNTDLTPRVVRTELKFNLTHPDYRDLTFEYIEQKKDFILLRSMVLDRHHGDVLVKLLRNV